MEGLELEQPPGNFKNDERLVDRICDDCQKVCSQLEDVFAHNSPEAFFQEMVGRVRRKNHKRKNIFYEPTFGIPPLAIVGKHPGHDFEILWELVPDPAKPGIGGCAPMSQLVLISQNDNYLMDTASRVILEVEAGPALFHQETVAARRMIERVEKLGLRPKSLGADKAYGSGEFLA